MNKKMSREYELISKFTYMFPELSPFCRDFEKIGSKSIVIHLKDIDDVRDEIKNGYFGGKIPYFMETGNYPKKLFFMYYDDTNWNLGTKMWRKKPKKKNENPSDADIDYVKNDIEALSDLVKKEEENIHEHEYI